MQTLTLGGSTTGNIVLSPNNGTGFLSFNTDSFNDITGSGIAISSNALSLDILSSSSSAGLSSSRSGLEFNVGAGSKNQLGLLQGCANGQVLKWDSVNGIWACGSDVGGISSASISVQEGLGAPITGIDTIRFTANDFDVTNAGATGIISLDSSLARWNQNLGTAFTGNTTLDLLIGGSSTSSAQFAITGVYNDAPVATLAGSTNNGLVLDANNSTLQSLRNNTLTIGGGTTGNISIAPNNSTGILNINAGGLNINGSPGSTTGVASCVTVTNGIVTGIGSCGVGSGGSVWDVTNGIITPKLSSTLDFLLGSSATASAKFAVLGVNTNTPTASVSSQNAQGYALYLDPANGALQTLRNQTLTLGGGTTGTIAIVENTDVTGTLTSSGLITATSGLTSNGTVAVNAAGGITTNQATFPLAQGASTINMGASGGTLNLGNGGVYTIATVSNDDLTLAPNGTGALNLGTTNTGNLNLGNGTGEITLNIQGADATGDMYYRDASGNIERLAVGSGAQCLLGGAIPAWGTCTGDGTGTNYWQLTGAVLSPGNLTTDFTLGGTSTASAKFAVLGVNTNTPTASVSSQNAQGYALYLDPANGALQTLRNQTLTLGGGTTGTIAIVENTDVTGTLTSSGLITATSGLTSNGTVAVNAAGGITTNQATFPLAQGASTINMGASGGTLNLGNGGVYTIATVSNDDLTLAPNGTGALNLGTTNTGNLNLGNGTGEITLNIQGADATGDMYYRDASGNIERLAVGSGAQCLLGGAIPAWGTCTGDGTGTNYWQLTGAVLSPGNLTTDFTLGGTSTASAKFAVLGVNTNTPTASVSSQNAQGYALYLDPANGALQTLRNQTLTLGGGTTGTIAIVENTDVTGTLTSSGLITATSGLTSNGTVAVNAAGGITTNQATFPLAQGASTINMGASGGTLNLGNGGVYTIATVSNDDLTLAPNGTGALNLGTTNTGNLNLGNGTGEITLNIQGADATGDMYYRDASGNIERLAVGSGAQCLLGGAIPAWGTCTGDGTGTNYWQLTGAVLSPGNLTTDFTLGGTSTASAKFAVLGVNTNTPTASVSSQNAQGYALYLDPANGALQTLRNQTLTLGGGTTGTIAIVENTDVTGTLTSSGLITATSGLTSNGTVAVNAAGGITTNQATFPLAQGASTINMGASGGTLNLGNGGVYTIATVSNDDLTLAPNGTGALNLGTTNTGNLNLGNGTGEITLNIQGADATGDMYYRDASGNIERLAVGSGAQCLLGGAIPAWGTCTGDGTGTNYWQLTGAVLSPGNLTTDFTLGGTSTASAKFAVLGVNTNTPTASVSSQNAQGYALYLDPANGALQTLRNQTLTLGGGTTGTIAIVENTDVTGTLTSSGLITATSGLTSNGTVAVNAAGGITTNQATFPLAQGASTINMGASGGTLNLGNGGVYTIATVSNDDLTLAPNGTGALNLGTTNTGNLNLGNGTGEITLNIQGADATGDMYYRDASGNIERLAVGSGAQCLLGGAIPAWGTCTGDGTGTNYWQLTGAVLSPGNLTTDFTLGGTSTASAKFAVLGVNTNTPTASVSSQNAQGYALYLDPANGALQTLRNQTLTLGGGTTGTIAIVENTDVTGTLTSSGLITATSGLTSNGTVAVNAAGGITTNQATFPLAQGASTINMGASGGTLNLGNGGVYTIATVSNDDLTLAPNGTGALNLGTTNTGNLNLGNGTGEITLNIQGADATGDMYYRDASGNIERLAVGSGAQCLLGGAIPAWGTCTGDGTGTNYWQLTGAVLSPGNLTTDFTLGGTSTASAKFAVLGVNTNTPTASVSSQNAQGYALYLDPANGALQTLRNQTLTLGGGTTGTIAIVENTDVTGTLTSSGLITATSGLTSNGTVAVNAAGGITTNQATFPLAQGASTINMGASGGTLNLGNGGVYTIATVSNDDLTLAPNGTGALNLGTTNTGNLNLGNGTGEITLNIQGADATGDMYYRDASGNIERLAVGSGAQCLLGGAIPAWGTCTGDGTGTNYWQLTGAVLSPGNLTTDFTLGGTSTASAKFAVLGVNTNTPTASVSSQNAQGYALYLDPANGALQTLRNQTLTLGGGTTGTIAIVENTDVTGTLTSSGLITATSGLTSNGTVAVNAAGGITTNQATFPLAQGASTINMGASGGTLNLGNGGVYTIATVSNDDLTLAPNGTGALNLGTTNTGNLNLGNGTGEITLNIQGADATGDMYYRDASGNIERLAVGSGAQCLLGGAIPAWGTCTGDGTGTNYWQLTGAVLSPGNLTTDFTLGGTSTASAKFAVLGVNTNTPTASVSSQNAQGYALYLDPANGALQTLRNQTLTLGGGTTGTIAIVENTDVTGTLTSSGLITATSGLTSNGTVAVNAAGGITTNQATFPLAQGASTINMGASGGTLNLGNGGVYTIATVSNDDLTLAPNGTGALNLGTTNTGNLNLGNGTGEITLNIQGADATGDMYYRDASGNIERLAVGSGAQCLLGGAIPAWGTCTGDGTGTNYWQLTGAVLSPGNLTTDFTLGGTSTASAKFAVLGVNTNTPTASVSSQNAQGYALYLDPANGALQTLRNQTLTLGGGTTGTIAIVENTDVTGTLTSSGLITATSGLTSNGTVAVNAAGGITTNQATFPLAQGASTINMGASGGTLNLGNGGVYTIATVSNDDLTLAPNGTGALNLGTTNTGNLNLGNGTGEITLNIQGADATGDMYYRDASGNIERLAVGSGAQCLLGGAIPAWGTCTGDGTGTNYWQLTGAVLSPGNLTTDFTLGGTSTASAKFAVLGVNTNTPTASVSSQNAQGYALYLDPANGALQTLRNQTLTLGGEQKLQMEQEL